VTAQAPRLATGMWPVAGLIALGAAWGSSFMFVALALEALGPTEIVAGRLAIGAAALTALLFLRGEGLPRRPRDWFFCFAIAVVSNLLPFTLISWGQQSVPSSMAALLMATGPLVSLVLAHLCFADDRITLQKLAGLALGMAGIVLLIGPSALEGLGAQLLGQLAIAGAACCYAVGGIVVRFSRGGQSPLQLTGGSLLIAALLSLAIAIGEGETALAALSVEPLLAVVVLGLLSTAGANFLFVNLVQAAGPSFAQMVNFLVPAFGLFFGWLFLAESLKLTSWLAFFMILSALWIVRRARRKA